MNKSPFPYYLRDQEHNLSKTRQCSPLLCSKGREWIVLFTEITHHTVMLYQLHAVNVFATMKKKSIFGTVQATASNNVVIIILNSKIHWVIVWCIGFQKRGKKKGPRNLQENDKRNYILLNILYASILNAKLLLA